MKLRSNKVFKRAKPKIDSNIKNEGFISEKRLSLRSNKSNYARRGGSEAKIRSFVDRCDENLEMGMKESLNTDDKGLFLGSEVLDPVKDSVVSCTKDENEEEEGNETMSIHLHESGHDYKEEIKSSCVDCENGSRSLESETFVDDTMIVNRDDVKETSLNDLGNANLLGKCKKMKQKGRQGRKKKNVGNLNGNESNQEKNDVIIGVNHDDDECTNMPLKNKRGTKRKNVEASDSECNGRAKKEKTEKDSVQVTRKVLQSSGGPVAVVYGGVREVVLGLKRLDEGPKKILKRRGRPRKVLTEGENMRPKKKLKKRGRPCKLQGKITLLPLNEMPRKNLKRRGRPPKVSHEIPAGPVKSHGIYQNSYGKGIIFKKSKRERTSKMEARTLATHVIKMRTVKQVKKRPKICKDGKFLNAGKGFIDGSLARNQLKQLIRDKISTILSKCGWTVKFRQRQERSYSDSVYVEPNGKNSHWSITGAYAKLKRKIENGNADNNEMSAFTPIPEEEISMLFRQRNHECKKKKKKILKNVKKGKTVIDKKKKHGKKSSEGSKRKIIFKPRLLVHCSENGPKQENEGVLVIKKLNLLSWMIDLGVILTGTKVQYGKTRRQKKSSEGVITIDGICCGCCNEIMGITEFGGHCGGKFDQVFDNLYLESGACLRKCLMDSWRKEEESHIKRFNVVDVQGDDPNDDTCNICGDGGNLICCDSCPSTFHQSCLDVQNFPSGDWNCIYCKCKFCGVVSISTPQVEDTHDAITSNMPSCCLCEEKFHQSCLQEDKYDINDSNILPFCGNKCQELFERLQAYLGVKHELEDGFSWTLLQRSDVDQNFHVHGTQLKVEHNSKLAVAFSVMDECFVPIVDERSGTNIIRNVIYNCGSNLKRLNYVGFLTAVLEKGDEFITVASIRIHGYRLAEMPFIGTRHTYRRQGMCRRLLDAIESTLSSLGVEELIIPAIPALLQTWTNAFGFMPLEESKKQAMKCMSMMVFPGIDMLKKPLQNQSADVDHTLSAGVCKEVIDHEQKEETNLIMVNCCSPEPTDKNNPKFETTSSNAKDCNQTSNGIISVCDLNLPLKNVLPCDTDSQTSIDSESFPDCTIKPGSLESVICGNHESSELNLDVENDGVHGVEVEPSHLTSKLVLKNTFDLNLHPTAVETDLHIASDDSVQCESRACIKSYDLSGSRSQLDQTAGSQTDSKTCESQPLATH
ncbi:hypothetical protein R6Q57_017461 [Mikania cordata]